MTSEFDPVQRELIDLTQRLLDSIAAGDWATYVDLCDPTLTAFEPEALGHLVQGMGFHQFYFDLASQSRPVNTTIASPHVRIMNDVAVVVYNRLIQKVTTDGTPTATVFEETRVWQKQDGKWRHVHFHRSANQ